MKRISSLSVLLEMFPEKEWDGISLVQNPSMNWDIVKSNPQIDDSHKWLEFYRWLAANPNISWETIQSNSRLYSSGHLYSNPNIPLSVLLNAPREKLRYLYSNPAITLDIIKKHSDIHWDYHKIATSKKISDEDLKSNILEKYNDQLSYNRHITWELIINNPQIQWNYYQLSDNKILINMVKTILRDHPEIKFDYESLTCNEGITFDDIKNNPDIPWDYESLFANPNIPLGVIDRFITGGCIEPENGYSFIYSEYCDVGLNKNLTWDFIAPKVEPFIFYDLSHNGFSNVPAWNYGEGWHFVPQTKKFPFRMEIWMLHQICLDYNHSIEDTKRGLYIPNEIYHMIIELLLCCY